MTFSLYADTDEKLPDEILAWAKKHRLRLYTRRQPEAFPYGESDKDKAILTEAYCLPYVTEAYSVMIHTQGLDAPKTFVEDTADPLAETHFKYPGYLIRFRADVLEGTALFVQPFVIPPD
jgi:hypothetical protein